MSNVATFHGFIETTQDSLLVFEACRRGLLPKASRRLQEKERQLVRSGSVFVFDEKESGIKRWTDGLVWSPSRILGNFLIYRELEKSQKRKLTTSSTNVAGFPLDAAKTSRLRRSSADQAFFRERQLKGSFSETCRTKSDGLIKKTMSVVVNGAALHLISYYYPDDVLSQRLRTPSTVPELANLEISPELLVKRNFRIPPMIERDGQKSLATDKFPSTMEAMERQKMQLHQRTLQTGFGSIQYLHPVMPPENHLRIPVPYIPFSETSTHTPLGSVVHYDSEMQFQNTSYPYPFQHSAFVKKEAVSRSDATNIASLLSDQPPHPDAMSHSMATAYTAATSPPSLSSAVMPDQSRDAHRNPVHSSVDRGIMQWI